MLYNEFLYRYIYIARIVIVKLERAESSSLEMGRESLMKFPAFLAPYLEGHSPKRLLQGLIAGAAVTLFVGFNWSVWQLSSTADKRVMAASEAATVSALAPICAAKFEQAANTNSGLVDELAAVRIWERDTYLIKAGWATFPGGKDPEDSVAVACADMVSKALKLKN